MPQSKALRTAYDCGSCTGAGELPRGDLAQRRLDRRRRAATGLLTRVRRSRLKGRPLTNAASARNVKRSHEYAASAPHRSMVWKTGKEAGRGGDVLDERRLRQRLAGGLGGEQERRSVVEAVVVVPGVVDAGLNAEARAA